MSENNEGLGRIVRALRKRMSDEYGPSRGIVIPGWKDGESLHVAVTPEEADMNPGKEDAVVDEKMKMLATVLEKA